MAITSLGKLARDLDYDKQRTAANASGQGYYGEIHHSPQPFKPTGQGLGVRRPHVHPTEGNANATLYNYGVAKNAPVYLARTRLWVENIESAFKVSGQYGQAHSSKTWYPKNFFQDVLTITGWVPNQYQYDNLVRFVMHSHHTALQSSADNYFNYVDFKLYRPQNTDRSFYHVPPGGVHYGLIITDIDAGHERFQFAKQFILTCKVTNDFRDNQKNLYQSIEDKIDYVQIWGDPSQPTPVTIGTTPVSSKSLKQGQQSVANGVNNAAQSVTGAVTNLF